MSIQIRSGYINPLTTMTNTKQGNLLFGKNKMDNQAADLQIKRQQLQNTLLLMKSTGSDSGVSTVEQQKKLQDELEKVSKELQTAKKKVPNDATLSQTDNVSVSHKTLSDVKSRVDTYEKGVKEVTASGVYQLSHEKNSGYHISFIPYFG